LNSERIARIFDSGCRAVFAVTGGGSGALHSLLSTPGASRFVADARIPYSPEALADFLGEKVEQSCSPEAALLMARIAFKFQVSGFKFLSISCTAALATDRNRRGDDRAFICIKTEASEKTYALYFSQATRAEQEILLSDWLLALIAQAVGAERGLMLPGSFNPVHKGHFGMLKAAEEITGLRGVFELSAANVDKPDIPEETKLKDLAALLNLNEEDEIVSPEKLRNFFDIVNLPVKDIGLYSVVSAEEVNKILELYEFEEEATIKQLTSKSRPGTIAYLLSGKWPVSEGTEAIAEEVVTTNTQTNTEVPVDVKGSTTLGEVKAMIKDVAGFFEAFPDLKEEPDSSTIKTIKDKYGIEVSVLL